MENQSYLLFSLHGLMYGVETLHVREIVLLPELMPLVSATVDIVGIINLRERIVPIMDLDLHFGYQPSAYQLSDRIIFLEHQDALIGMIVHQVHDVKTIDWACISTEITYEATKDVAPFISGIARIDDDLITLLRVESLFQSLTLPTTLVENGASASLQQVARATPTTGSHVSPEEQIILHDRARSLSQRSETQELAGLLSFAVLKIGEEYFGIETTVMREFTDVSHVTPIPCCPDYIIGNLNLRGEIITLLSLHHILNTAQADTKKAIVVMVEDIIAGITVDEVLDVIYIHPSTIQPLPAAARVESQTYSNGMAAYANKMMTLLDLPRLLTQGELVVNEHA
ncbi:purine-binding chemotaxis protein CheW [Phormidium sp. CLA17]|uniref:chemotaxis protein CheW n=1 Tax=Leptolyngbya sp. Cla-17 TaxID=2803751 RepID=UPI0014923F2A|nr:chemotaxis protein CheW [Leptolyngbya sp. Cla-17]MBM0744620.1 purine-binding chemotaxis protein CheW [Leptolyngbya sp. Cla-17]